MKAIFLHIKIKSHLLQNFITLFGVIFLLTNCGNTSSEVTPGDDNASTVVVLQAPQNMRPLVFLGEGGRQVCRKGRPDDVSYGELDQEVLRTVTNAGNRDNNNTARETEGETNGSTPTEGGNTTGTTTGTTENNETTESSADLHYEEVGENWFQMGLTVLNTSTIYYLIINHLTFSISANWGDSLLGPVTKEITADYCGGLGFIYLVRPTPRNRKAKDGEILASGIDYKPYPSKDANYQNSLTIYVDGVPIPDGPPVYQQTEAGGNDTLNDIRNTANQNAPPRETELFVLRRLPAYKVQVLLNGYFIKKDGNRAANFRKRIEFSLSSRFLQ